MHIIILLDSPFTVKQLAYFMKKLQSLSRDVEILMSIATFVSDWSRFEWFTTIRQGFNTILQDLKCIMDKINISLSGLNRLQWNLPKKLLMSLSDNYYMSFFTKDDSVPSVEQKRKYAAMTNLGAESDSAVLDSNFRWLGVSSNLQKILEYFS